MITRAVTVFIDNLKYSATIIIIVESVDEFIKVYMKEMD